MLEVPLSLYNINMQKQDEKKIVIRPVKLSDYQDIHKNLFLESTEASIKEELEKELPYQVDGTYLRCIAEVDGNVFGQVCFYRLSTSGKTHIVKLSSAEVAQDTRMLDYLAKCLALALIG